jgi:hypothetical protein
MNRVSLVDFTFISESRGKKYVINPIPGFGSARLVEPINRFIDATQQQISVP